MAGQDEDSFNDTDIFGGDVIAEAMAFMQSGGAPAGTAGPAESSDASTERHVEPKASARADGDDELHLLDLSTLVPKAEEPKADEPAKADETPKAEEPKQRLVPTPEQRAEMRILKMQQEFQARLDAQEQRYMALLERVMPQAAPEPAEEPADEALDPLEREVSDLKTRLAELQHVEMERRQEAAKQGIVSEVDSALANLQHLEPFRDHIYTAIARDAQRALAEAEKTGRAPKYVPIATIVTQVDQAVRMAAGRLNGSAKPAAAAAAPTSTAAATAAPAAKPAAPAAKSNVHPATPTGKSASASQVLDVRKHSFEDLAYLTTRQYQAAQGR